MARDSYRKARRRKKLTGSGKEPEKIPMRKKMRQFQEWMQKNDLQNSDERKKMTISYDDFAQENPLR